MSKTSSKVETSLTPVPETKSSTTYTQSNDQKTLEEKLSTYLTQSLGDIGRAQKKQSKIFEESLRRLKESEIDPLRESLSGELIKLRDRSDRTIETIGIFAALLSFVTFEAQIFKSDLNGWTLIGLSSLLLGALLLFVFTLSNAFNTSKREDLKSYLQPLVILPSLLVIFGLGTASIGYKTDSQERKEILIIQEEIKNLKFQYSEDNISITERINEIENKINNLSNKEQSEFLEEFKECIKSQGLVRCL